MKRLHLMASAVALLVVAVLAVLIPRFQGTKDGNPPRAAEIPGSGARKSGSAETASPAVKEPEPDFETDEDGVVDTADYDADQDGQPEIGTYVRIYRMLKTSAGKYDMLQNVRILGPPDDPVINELIITEAARSEDPEIRRAAREALFEYGGENAQAALADYLATQTGILDLEELKLTLDKTGLPSLKSNSGDK